MTTGAFRKGGFGWPILGSLAALVVPPAAELVTGNEMSYTISIFVLFVLFWVLTKMSRAEIGLRFWDLSAYTVSFIYPVVLLALAAAVSAMANDVNMDRSSFGEALFKTFIMFAATWLGALLTEDGLFRGWLWGSLSRTGMGPRGILAWTSLVFGLWHLPVAIIEENFRLPPEVIPVYVANACLLGLAWGIIRLASGSIVVAAFCHGIWNGIVYIFFGYGTKSAVLGITRYDMFDPERGLLGLALNAIAVAILWRWAARRVRRGDAGV